MIRVVIADDHPVVREGLRRIVEAERGLSVVGDAADAGGLLEIVRTVPVDVVLADVGMPGPGIVALVQQIKAYREAVRVLVLSVHSEDQYAKRALRAGASGYLTKDRSSDELITAIRKVATGGRYVSAEFAERLVAELDGSGPSPAPHETLSDREFEVLQALAQGKAVSQIAADLALSPKTVSTYRSRILEKLKLASNADVVRYALKHGLIE